MKGRRSLGVVPAIVGIAMPAVAAPLPDAAELVLPACSDLSFTRGELIELVGLELRAVGIRHVDANMPSSHSAAVAVVTVGGSACGGSANPVDLEISNPGSGKLAKRSMPIADVSPELRARALAIGVVELIRTEWPRLTQSDAESPAPAAVESLPVATSPVATSPVAPEPQQEPRVPPADPFVDTGKPSKPVHAEHRAFGVSAALVAWLFPNRSTTLFGPGAGAALELGSLRLSAGGQILFGQTIVPAGTIDMGSANAYVGVGLVGGGPLRASVEPRLYLGHGWATGTPSDPNRTEGSSASGFVIAPALAFGLRSELVRGCDGLLDLEIGYAGRGLSFLVEDDTSAGLSRLLLGARIGIDFGL